MVTKAYISKTELALRMGRTENTIARWARQGCPHVMRVSNSRGRAVKPFFNERDVRRWLLEQYKKEEIVNE